MDEEKFRKFVESCEWIFAKTYAKTAPHEYIVKEHLPVRKVYDFIDAVVFIRKYGYDEMFYSKKFRYYDLDGHKYWTMGNAITETRLINRAKI